LIYAQITNNIIVNTVELNDPTLVPVFLQGYDSLVEITSISPMPAIGWYYDLSSDTFWPTVSGYNYSNILSAPQEPGYQYAVSLNVSFGNQLITQISADAAVAGVYQATQTAAFLSYLSQLYLFLQTGFLLDANDEFTTLIADTSTAKTNLSPFVTNTLLTAYQTQLQSWLGI
jgi:hypothetical protein